MGVRAFESKTYWRHKQNHGDLVRVVDAAARAYYHARDYEPIPRAALLDCDLLDEMEDRSFDHKQARREIDATAEKWRVLPLLVRGSIEGEDACAAILHANEGVEAYATRVASARSVRWAMVAMRGAWAKVEAVVAATSTAMS